MTQAAGSVLLYTVPAAKVALLKSLRIVNQSGSQTFVRVGVGATTTDKLVANQYVAGDATAVDPDTDPIVLAAGETLKASVPVAGQGPVTITGSGALLDV